MKKFLKTLVGGICLFTLLCCALPAAFAAGNTSGSKKEQNVFAIGMDAQGGICSTVVTYTNLSGKLESTPEQPTMTGYRAGRRQQGDHFHRVHLRRYHLRALDRQGRCFHRAAARHPARRDSVAEVCRARTGSRCPAYHPAGLHHVLNNAVKRIDTNEERDLTMTTSTMKLPASYAVIDAEEMTYLDGGASSAYQSFLDVGKVFNYIARIFSGASSIINNVNVIYQSFVSLNSLLTSFGK